MLPQAKACRLRSQSAKMYSYEEPAMSVLSTTYQHILFESHGAIAYVTMNRPAKRNALSVEHMQELIGCLKLIGDQRDLAVVIVRGNGPAFCAGHDLAEMIGQSPEFFAVLRGLAKAADAARHGT